MKLLKFPKTSQVIRERIRRKYPTSLPTIDELDQPGHILWMLDQLGAEALESIDQTELQREINEQIHFILGVVYALFLLEKDVIAELIYEDESDFAIEVAESV